MRSTCLPSLTLDIEALLEGERQRLALPGSVARAFGLELSFLITPGSPMLPRRGCEPPPLPAPPPTTLPELLGRASPGGPGEFVKVLPYEARSRSTPTPRRVAGKPPVASSARPEDDEEPTHIAKSVSAVNAPWVIAHCDTYRGDGRAAPTGRSTPPGAPPAPNPARCVAP